MNIFLWIVFGLLVGIAANFIDPRPAKGGILSAIALGILGAIVGGFIGGQLLGIPITGFNLSSFVMALAGAMLLLLAGRTLTHTQRKT